DDQQDPAHGVLATLPGRRATGGTTWGYAVAAAAATVATAAGSARVVAGAPGGGASAATGRHHPGRVTRWSVLGCTGQTTGPAVLTPDGDGMRFFGGTAWLTWSTGGSTPRVDGKSVVVGHRVRVTRPSGCD